MKRFEFLSFAPLLVFAAVVGCSDPSADVPKSATSDPVNAATVPADAAATVNRNYVIRSDSRIDFVGSKITGKHDGGFKNFAGSYNVVDGKIAGSPEIKINLKSIWTDTPRLTGHLRSADFFDVEKFPVATFTATSIEADGDNHKITGNLDLHGVTKSISFPAKITIADEILSVDSEFAINRKDFNINYPGKPNDLIRDNVVLKFAIKATPGEARPEDQLVN